VNVVSTGGFPASGTFLLAGAAVTYTGKTATSFTGCGNHAATTGGETVTGNAPTGTSLWTFVKQAGITPQTAQMIAAYDDEGVYLQGNGYAISDWTLDAAGTFGATLMGLYLASIANPALTAGARHAGDPADAARRPVPELGRRRSGRKRLLARLHDRPANLVLDGCRRQPLPRHDRSRRRAGRLTGTIPKRRMNANDWAALIQTSTFHAIAKWIGRSLIGATVAPYQMWVDMPSCQYTAVTPDELNQSRRHGASYNFWAAYDETAGYDVKISLLGSLASVVAYP
jgi:hypothetical protein